MLTSHVDQIPTITLFGLVGHVLFKRLEPRGSKAILSLLLGPPTILAILFLFFSSYHSIVVASTLPYIIYLTTLACSVVTYRLSPFHPLSSYPGPIICKITRLWNVYIVWTGKQHLYYKYLHARYGTHVRTGPNHLTICDAEAIPTVLGTNGFGRSERYQVTMPEGTNGNLISLMDKLEHAQRRRVWDRGLNTSAVQGYQDMLAKRINQFIEILEGKKDTFDLGMWFSCFSFDFMGDLAFGGAFNLMEQGGDRDGYMGMVGLVSRHQELCGAIPWVKPWHERLPSSGYTIPFRTFAKDSVLDRKDRGSVRKDVFYYLLDEEGAGSGPPSVPQLTMEAGLAIAAGSDTTGSLLANLFYYLISNSKSLARLQAEIDITFPSGAEVFDHGVTANMKYLNAVINETLRFQPPAPSGVPRIVPSEGSIVAGRFVQGGTIVQIPIHALHRDARYFPPDPDSFRPERWLETSKGGHKLQQSAFIPFSYGPMNCAGKYLALQEQRVVICALLQKFDFEFAPGWDVNEWEGNLMDTFVLGKGPLPVIIKPRKN